MELHRTDEGFALYKEKTQIGFLSIKRSLARLRRIRP